MNIQCRRSSAWESTRLDWLSNYSRVKLKTELSWAQISPTALIYIISLNLEIPYYWKA